MIQLQKSEALIGNGSIRLLKNGLSNIFGNSRYFTNFDGIDDRIDFSSNIILSGDFELSFSVATTETGFEGIFYNASASTTDTCRLNAGGIQFGPLAGSFLAVTTPINDGGLHVISVERLGTTYNIYIDGVLDKTGVIGTIDVEIDTFGRNAGSVIEGTISDIKAWTGGNKTTGTLIVDMPINESGGDIVVNKASVLGSELWNNTPQISGDGWVNNLDGSFTHSGVSIGELRISGLLVELNAYLITVSANQVGCTLKLGGPEISNNSIALLEGTHSYILNAENTGTINAIRFISSGDGVIISNITVKEIPSTTPYATRVNMVDNTELFTKVIDGWEGQEVGKIPFSIESFWTDNLDGSYTINQPDSSFNRLSFNENGLEGETFKVKFNISDAVGLDILRMWGSGNFTFPTATSFNEIIVRDSGFTLPTFARSGGSGAFSQTVSNISVKRFLQTN